MTDGYEGTAVNPAPSRSLPKIDELADRCDMDQYSPPEPISSRSWTINGHQLGIDLLYLAKGIEIARQSAKGKTSYVVSARLTRDIVRDEVTGLQRTISNEWEGSLVGYTDKVNAVVSSPLDPHDAYECATLILDILQTWGLVENLPWHKETMH